MFLRSIRYTLWAMSIAAVIAFAWTAATRAFQLPLDQQEQRDLDAATRIASSQPLYAAPSADAAVATDAADTDMPGLPAIASVLVRLFGSGPWAVRVPGMLAVVAVTLLATWMVRVETDSDTLAMAVAGVFLGGMLLEPDLVGRCSPQLVMLTLVLGGFALLRMLRGFGGPVLGAAVLAGAAFVHAFALWWIAAALAHLLTDDRRRALVFVLALGVFGGGGYVLLSQHLGPGFGAAATAVLPGIGFHPARALRLVGDQLLGRYGTLTLVVVMSVALPVRPWNGAGGIWMWMALAAVTCAVLATQTATPEAVALLPSVLALAIVGPVAMQRVARHLSAWPGSTRLAGQGVVLAALALQFTALLSRLPSALLELAKS